MNQKRHRVVASTEKIDAANVQRAAKQLPKIDRWAALLAYICRRIVARSALPTPPPALAAPG